MPMLRRCGGRMSIRLSPMRIGRRRVRKAGDHAQQRGLAAAGGPEQREELAVFDLERDVANGCTDPKDRHAVDRYLAQPRPQI